MKNIAKYFQFEQLKTNFKTEIIAGITTYISMVYIMFVNPNVLGASGMDKGAIFTATALASAIGCFLMGILANYPIASAPALGINAFFAYSVVIGMKVPWQTALAGVFVASLIFLLITIFKLRELIINAIPADLKHAISAGIGMFVAFLGLSQGGLVVANPDTMVVHHANHLDHRVWLGDYHYPNGSPGPRGNFLRDGSDHAIRHGNWSNSRADPPASCRTKFKANFSNRGFTRW